jgi:hypothetical protein
MREAWKNPERVLSNEMRNQALFKGSYSGTIFLLGRYVHYGQFTLPRVAPEFQEIRVRGTGQ